MKETIFHVIEHSFLDLLVILPFLFACFLFIEFVEHKASEKMGKALTRLGPFGAVGGAALGCVPQCGFSVMASNLYAGRLISIGTLVAVFISTSDEAIPIMVSSPEHISSVWKLILCKIIIAVIAGITVDLVAKALSKGREEKVDFEDICADCGCGCHSIWYSALKHTFEIAVFILIVNIILGGCIEFIGEDKISKVLMTNSIFQPFVASLIGFIPNCASSVLLTDLYIEGMLSFGSCVAGLCTGAGVGLVVLFKANKKLRENLVIALVLYAVSVVSGLIINLVM